MTFFARLSRTNNDKHQILNFLSFFFLHQIFHSSHSHPSVGIRRSHHIVLLHLRSEDRNDLLRLAELSVSLPSLVHATRLLLLAHRSLYRSFSLPFTPRLDSNHRQIALLRLRLRVQHNASSTIRHRSDMLTAETRLEIPRSRTHFKDTAQQLAIENNKQIVRFVEIGRHPPR